VTYVTQACREPATETETVTAARASAEPPLSSLQLGFREPEGAPPCVARHTHPHLWGFGPECLMDWRTGSPHVDGRRVRRSGRRAVQDQFGGAPPHQSVLPYGTGQICHESQPGCGVVAKTNDEVPSPDGFASWNVTDAGLRHVSPGAVTMLSFPYV